MAARPVDVPGGRHVLIGAALALILIAIGGDLSPAPANAACLNEPRRAEQAATLPECRAYELVTPPSKGSGQPQPITLTEIIEGSEIAPLVPARMAPARGARASLDGSRMAWFSDPVPGAASPGLSYLASRGGGSWSSEGLVPPMSPFNDLLCPIQLGVSGWSADLTRSVLDLPAGPPSGFREERECGHPEPRLVADEPERFRNLFVRDNQTGSYSLVNVTPPGTVWPQPEEFLQPYWPASFLAGSDDLTHVVFEQELKLTPDAPIGYRGGDELYEWAGGEVRLVSVLPDDTAVHGALAGATRNYFPATGDVTQGRVNIAHFHRAVSADGSRIFFETPGDEGAGDLYLREDGEQTLQIDLAEAGAPGPSGGGDFQGASADGSRVFFTSDHRLTADSTAETARPDLYEYDVEAGELRDLTPNPGEAAGVLGVSSVSQSGSRVYFVAEGVLSEGANSEGDTAVSGQPNLYLSYDGTIGFVATLDATADACGWRWNSALQWRGVRFRPHCQGFQRRTILRLQLGPQLDRL